MQEKFKRHDMTWPHVFIVESFHKPCIETGTFFLVVLENPL